MATIAQMAAAAYRAYAIDGVPSTGAHKPSKLEIIAIFNAIQALISADVAVAYATRAELFADLAHPAGAKGEVWSDATPAYNGVYSKLGASGTGSWTKISDFGVFELDARLDVLEALNIASRLSALDARLAAETRVNVPRVAYIGDSMMQLNNFGTVTGAPIYSAAIGEIVDTHAISPRFNIDTWADTTTTQLFQGANKGIGGNLTNVVLARIAEVSGQAPDIAIISVGINDVLNDIATATIIANRKAITDALTARGILVINFGLRPVSSAWAVDGSPRLTAITDVNAALLADSIARPTNNVYFDVYTPYNNAGRPKTGFLHDGLHPSPLGAWYTALTFYHLINSLIKPFNDLPTFEVGNLLPNPTFLGTGGTLNARATGLVADNYAVGMADGTAVSVVSSLGTNTDGSKYHHLAFTPGGAAAVEHCYMQLVTGSIPVSLDGKWVKFYVPIRISNWPAGWRSFFLVVSNQLTQLAFANAARDETQDTYPPFAFDFTLVTPPFLIPTGTTSLAPVLAVGIIGAAAGTGSIDVLKWWMGEVPDPRPTRNF